MSEEPIGLEKRAALARRAYWQSVYDTASRAGDADAAQNALRFIREYDDLLSFIDGQKE